MKALIIDDEPGIRLALGRFLQMRGFEIQEASTGAEGLVLAKKELPDLVFLDQRLPDMDGESILPLLVAQEIGACVIMMTAFVELDQAVRAMKHGAEYFFPKPFDLNHLAIILESVEERFRIKNAAGYYRQLNELSDGQATLVGSSPQILKIQRLISLLARNRGTPVLILGESGCGKELVARAIHQQSGATGPLVEINSASLSESLLESELFGHEKGAFTDASKVKKGLFEIAADGTIFFDELAEMPLPIQAKLLKVLDTKMFRRVGGVADLTSNARFIGATNRDIASLAQKGLFRADLLYRINVIPVNIPPLRDRAGDIVILAEYFIRQLGHEMGRGRLSTSSGFMDALVSYRWPGNVRELKNVVERAIILADGGAITEAHIPLELRPANSSFQRESVPERMLTLQEAEDGHIRDVLRFTGDNHSRTASILGISRSTLLAKLKKLKSSVQ